MKPFWLFRDDLYTLKSVPMFNNRMYISMSLKGEVLDCLHSAHQGEANMKSSARDRFFWPGMDAAVSQKH